MNSKDASIVAQTAAKVAGTIFQGTGDVTGWRAAFALIHNAILEDQGKGVDTVVQTPAAVPPAVAEAFPQATQVRTDNDSLWNDILTNPENWWNNIEDGDTTVSGGKRPDFRHKTLKDDQGRQKGMFMVDSRWGKHAPPAVFEMVGIPYPGSPQPVVAAPPPPPTPF